MTIRCALLLMLVYASNLVYAQPTGVWQQGKELKNLQDHQDVFNAYWAKKDTLRGQGFKQFKRWEYFWETRLMPDGTFPTQSFILEQFREASSLVRQSRTPGQWEPLGPFDFELTGSWSAGHGRINFIHVDPIDSNTIYIGAPNGGIWKTTNAGVNWEVLNDDMGVIGVSTIAIDPLNADIIYIGTGDNDANDSYSIGVMKSLDGGDTWNPAGLVFNTTSMDINNLLLDPANNQVLYVTTNQGIYKSLDAGESFDLIFGQYTRAFAFKPGDSQVMYAATSSRFYKSTNGGDTFVQISDGLPISDVGRIVIGVSPADPEVVYLLMANSNYGMKGLYRSADEGNSFTWMNASSDIFNNSNQAWYDLAITVDPEDANTIYTGVIDVWKSTNGGANFTQVSSWSAPTSDSYTHADIHFLGFYNGALYCGSDGGIYRSYDGGDNFQDLSSGLQIGQFYEIDGTQSNPDVFAGGLQDNGGYFTQTGGDTWKCYYGADGMDCAIDPTNENVVYGAIQFGSIYRSTNGGNSIAGIGSPEQGAWVTPIALDPNNADRLIGGYENIWAWENGSWSQISSFGFSGTLRVLEISESNPDYMYLAQGGNIYRTTDGGSTINALPLVPGENITDISVHPTDPLKVWVTVGGWSSSKKVYRTEDGGITWTNITYNLPNIPTNCIVCQEGTNGGVYVGNDFGVYYYNEDLSEWISFQEGLPRTTVSDLYINYTDSKLTAGTFGRGVWQTELFTSSLFEVDLFVKLIENLEDAYCDSIPNPEVTMRNLGTETITGFTLNYGIDQLNQQMIWTGTLESLEEVTLIIDDLVPQDGNQVLLATVDQLLEGEDENPTNNSREKSFMFFAEAESVQFNLQTDCWGSESSWTIQNDDGELFASGQGYGNTALFEEIHCLPEGCYTFTMFDSYGDGLDGTSSGCSIDGYYALYDASGEFLFEMGEPNFGYEVSHDFCVGNLPLDVNISTDTPVACGEATVNFTDESQGNPISWLWEFEGGTPATSELQNPQSISYQNVGLFDVKLTIYNADGDMEWRLFNDYITIGQEVSFQMSVEDASCSGNADGSAFANVTNGTAPFLFGLSEDVFQPESLFANLLAGDYTLWVMDVNGCLESQSFAILEPEPIEVEVTIVDEEQGLDGSISLVISGGTLPYQVQVNGEPSGTEITGLAGGDYQVQITDANGCVFIQNYTVETTVGLIDLENLNCSVFPNPANDQLMLHWDQDIGAVDVVLFAEDGKEVQRISSISGTSVSMNVGEVKSGGYILHVTNGQSTKSLSIIIAH
jgi:photosystem II stability/assembly factor-like uncharacterized protein